MCTFLLTILNPRNKIMKEKLGYGSKKVSKIIFHFQVVKVKVGVSSLWVMWRILPRRGIVPLPPVRPSGSPRCALWQDL